MKFSLILVCIVLAGVLVEVLFPGARAYQNGWYNVALAALAIVLAMRARSAFAAAKSKRVRAAILVCGFGVGAVAFAGVSFGLFAPDPQTVIGAPGSSMALEGLELHFPLATEDAPERRLQGSYILAPQPRTVVGVDVFDAAGHHVTITQPTGVAFLSPVLLMQATQSIGGITVPYDSFSVPAVHRVVKAVLLGPDVVAKMPQLAADGSAVLFDVENDSEVEVPHGIGVARDGETLRLGGLQLRPHLLSYPAIRVMAIPNPIVVGLGTLAALVAMLLIANARVVRIQA